MKILQVFVILTILQVYGLRINITSRQAAIKLQQNIVRAIRENAVRRQKNKNLINSNVSTIQKTVKHNPLITSPMTPWQFTSTKTIFKNKVLGARSHNTFEPKIQTNVTVFNRPLNRKITSQPNARRYFQQRATIAQAVASFGQTLSKQYETHSTPGISSAKIKPKRNEKLKNNSILDITLPKDQTEFADLTKNNVSHNILQLSLAANLKDNLAKSIFTKLHDGESIWEGAEKLVYTQPGYHDFEPEFIWPSEVNLTRPKSGRRVWIRTDDKTAWYQQKHMIEIMKDVVYDAQDRLKALNRILDKYAGNVRFQIGYTFTVLESLNYDIRLFWTNLRRNFYWAYYKGYSTRMPMHTAKVSRNIIYYTYVFQKYIDVTYIVEQVCDKYENHLRFKRNLVEFYKTSMRPRDGQTTETSNITSAGTSSNK